MSFSSIKNFKDKIAQRAVVGPFAKSLDPAFIEVMGYAGFDYVILDMEHGPVDKSLLQNLIRAADISGVLPIVRVPENSLQSVSAALDLGAGGVQVPQVDSAESVRKVIDICKFAPIGNRGVCRFVRAADYSSMDKTEYFKKSNDSILVIQLEGVKALNNLEEIISVKGIDVIFIGPYDLSQSLGVPGDVENPKVLEAAGKIIESCANKNIATGIFVETPTQAKKWKEFGVRYISYSVDIGLFYQQCCEQIEAINA